MATDARRGAQALHLLVPLAVVGIVAALRPEIVTGTFSSAGSALRVAAVVIGWVAFSWLLRRVIPQAAVRTAVVAIAGAGLLWFTVVPYFQEKSVDDALPAATTPPESAASPDPAAPDAATPAAPAPNALAPSAPEKVATGQLRGLAGHRGSGEAAVYRQPDGSLLVRLDEFDVSNVPSPVLYVVAGPGRESPGGGQKLGPLRGSQGNQNFAVPAGTELRGTQTILIWCEAFGVPVAAATAGAL